ncbi:MAG: YggT family protein [Betaproteobacteria bacterium]|nr:YggT family protein [Betaproteobacteria bacterium]
MMSRALAFLVETAFGLFTIALLLRFYLQWARAPYRNPLSEFLHALTDFMVRPARRFIPGLWGLDIATLGIAWLVQLMELFLVLQIRGVEFGPEAGLAFLALVLMAALMLVKLSLYIIMVAVIVQAVLSWVNSYSPVMPLLNSMTRPFLRVFQRRIPPIGNVDLSPLFVVIVCQLLLMAPVAYLEVSVSRLVQGG